MDNQQQIEMLAELPKLRVSIIDKCQLKCEFCGGNSSSMENFQPQSMKNYVPQNLLETFIRRYIKHGGKYIQFTGGEPLLRKDIISMVKMVVNCGGIAEINTNGLCLTRILAQDLKNAGLSKLKISIPAFQTDKYKRKTGLDALDRVFTNIKTVKDIIDIRINIVATAEIINDISQIIDVCKNDLGVKQLLLLELLFYSHVHDAQNYFKSNYVDILNTIAPIIESKFKAKCEPFIFGSKLENLYRIRDAKSEFEVFIKQANKTLRFPKCKQCKNFCQEGAYELRLSTGGYLNICNISNEYGFDLSSVTNLDSIDNQFVKYKELFQDLRINDFCEFLKYHNIDAL